MANDAKMSGGGPEIAWRCSSWVHSSVPLNQSQNTEICHEANSLIGGKFLFVKVLLEEVIPYHLRDLSNLPFVILSLILNLLGLLGQLLRGCTTLLIRILALSINLSASAPRVHPEGN